MDSRGSDYSSVSIPTGDVFGPTDVDRRAILYFWTVAHAKSS